MRQLQFLPKKTIHENESIKIKMKTKKCLDCGKELNSDVEIIWHECDSE